MPTEVTVRAAQEGDVPAIRRVAQAAWHETYDDLLGEATVERMLAEGYDEDVLSRMVGPDDIGLFVAEVEGEVVGYASCGMTDPVGLGDLDVYVRPDRWGEGVGTALLERGFEHLRELGVDTVRDEVLAGNEVGNAFYREHLTQVGRRSVELGGEQRTVRVYERSLEPA